MNINYKKIEGMWCFKKDKVRILCQMVLACLITMTSVCVVAQEANLLIIQNDFIKIIVNNQDQEKGRFSIETTGGDPTHSKDDNQPLIYGRPKPWTSYTTVQVDGENYIFGGGTRKRAGKDGVFGKVMEQSVTENTLLTVTAFPKVRVEQRLQFFRNASTRVKDTAYIEYEIKNTDTATHNVGVRIMMDTMLGNNDGAPFRIGEKAFQSEQQFASENILPFWQTFDHLSSPNVVAQGTVMLEDMKLSPPDRMVLANWGTLADHPWNFQVKEGRSFIREGELEKDTALGIYWHAEALGPGQTRRVGTFYGLGGMTRSQGVLSLGLTAPAEVPVTRKTPFLMVGYLFNSGDFDSKNTVAEIILPEGFELVEGQAKQALDVVGVGESRQIAIKVKVKPNASMGKKVFQFKVTSDTLESNQLEREIEVNGPPSIALTVRPVGPVEVTPVTYINPSISIRNPNPFPLYQVGVNLETDSGIQLPQFENSYRRIRVLEPNETKDIEWHAKVVEKNRDKASYRVAVSSSILEKKTDQQGVTLIQPNPTFGLKSSRSPISVGDYFYVELKTTHEGQTPTLNMVWEGDATAIRMSPSYLVLQSDQAGQISFHQGYSKIEPLNLGRSFGEKRVCKVHFKAQKAGHVVIQLQSEKTVLSELILKIKE